MSVLITRSLCPHRPSTSPLVLTALPHRPSTPPVLTVCPLCLSSLPFLTARPLHCRDCRWQSRVEAWARCAWQDPGGSVCVRGGRDGAAGGGGRAGQRADGAGAVAVAARARLGRRRGLRGLAVRRRPALLRRRPALRRAALRRRRRLAARPRALHAAAHAALRKRRRLAALNRHDHRQQVRDDRAPGGVRARLPPGASGAHGGLLLGLLLRHAAAHALRRLGALRVRPEAGHVLHPGGRARAQRQDGALRHRLPHALRRHRRLLRAHLLGRPQVGEPPAPPRGVARHVGRGGRGGGRGRGGGAGGGGGGAGRQAAAAGAPRAARAPQRVARHQDGAGHLPLFRRVLPAHHARQGLRPRRALPGAARAGLPAAVPVGVHQPAHLRHHEQAVPAGVQGGHHVPTAVALDAHARAHVQRRQRKVPGAGESHHDVARVPGAVPYPPAGRRRALTSRPVRD